MPVDAHTDAVNRAVDALPEDPGAALGLAAPVVANFVRRYFGGVDTDEIAERSERDLAGAAVGHLLFGAVRAGGASLVRVVDPSIDTDGWTCRGSVVEVVTDDRPFLIDSVAIVLARHGIGIDFLVHPIETVRRDAAGRLTGFGTTASPGCQEAWVHFEIERLSDPALRSALVTEIAAALDDLAAADTDRAAMHLTVMDLASQVEGNGATDAAALLRWLADGTFHFLGARHYMIRDEPGGAVLRAVPGSGLGLLREQLRPPKGTRLDDMATEKRRRLEDTDPLVIAKDHARSSIVRSEHFEYIGVKQTDADGAVVGEHRFLGLFAADIARRSVFDTPYIAAKAEAVLVASGLSRTSHSGRELVDTLEVFPRDEMFEIPVDELSRIALGVVKLQERKQVRLFARRDEFGGFVSCLVYVPRDRFSTAVADRVVDTLRAAYGGSSASYDTRVTERILARIHVLVQLAADAPAVVDDDLVEQRLAGITRWWIDDLAEQLVGAVGEARSRSLLDRGDNAFPASYRETVTPDAAVVDLLRADDLTPDAPVSAHLSRALGAPPEQWRCKLMSLGVALPLSSVVPLLEHLGVRVGDERPHELRVSGRTVWLHDIGIDVGDDHARLTDPTMRMELQSSFVKLWNGEVDRDGLNQLVLRAGLTAGQVVVLRSYVRYLRQTGLPFTPAYVEATLVRHGSICASLVGLFEAKFAPNADAPDSAARTGAVDSERESINAALDAVTSLDDDRILRAVLGVIDATVRTNAYRPALAPSAPCSPALAFKLDPRRIPDLPLPRPMHEIWVCSPRVEGIHLRGGAIARGGLRWSDRMEDFRTEVLGLMKAQMVKNAVIVPVGAKGGFVCRALAPDPAARKAEVVACYEAFVGALLDVTDNLVNGSVVAAAGVVRHDVDDPYLVVAADKGTATFSDTANGVAARYGFWLGDAFASGGSAGYDHKSMAITARGAWESVRRHLLTIGGDADNVAFTVAGIGDMSGDVFGNGMLLSPAIRLVAAFDHRHVFIDPTPTTSAIDERRRLFALPTSSWDDYDRSLISAGGGVWPRSAKRIGLTDEARAVLGISADAGPTMTPQQLISAILRAPVDVLWNGGIGTYVKASSESHADAGDRANDAVRVDADELRCTVVAEGGNLGLTQRARIEFAIGGGLVNTDAIDNSAGVDCSDHEVNIKIALDRVMASGDLTSKQRNELLVSMTDEVAELVLADNRAQNLALAIARTQAFAMADVHARQIRALELGGRIDRLVEFLPDEQQLAERHAAGRGLTAPEFAVLLAYTKDTTSADVLASDLPDDPTLEVVLRNYFPSALRERFPDAIAAHPLRREIITTCIVNAMVNRAGLSFEHRMVEEASASTSDIVRAHLVAAAIFDLAPWWERIDALTSVEPAVQVELFLAMRRLVERASLWLLRHRRNPIDLASTIAVFRAGVAAVGDGFAVITGARFAAEVAATAHRFTAAGVPAELADRAAAWPYLHTALDVVELAAAHGVDVDVAASTYWTLFDRLGLSWLWERIAALPRTDRWQTQARAALRDDLLSEIRALSDRVLEAGDGVEVWYARHDIVLRRTASVFADVTGQGVFDLSTLTVALRQLRNLAVPISG